MCVLRADGKDFAVDKFLEKSSLKPSIVYYKGTKSWGNRINTTSGFNVGVSKAEFDDLKAQIIDVIIFLKKEKNELKRLVKFANVENVSIDFAISTPLKDIVIWTHSFPLELLKLLGSIGIELDFTIYPESY